MSSDERTALEEVRDKGSHKASKFKRAIVFLLADEGDNGPAHKNVEIAQATGLKTVSIERLRKRCCEVGPQVALDSKPRETPPRKIKITGEVEAHITHLACIEPPEGHVRCTLKLLAQRLVEMKSSTQFRTRKKGQSSQFVIVATFRYSLLIKGSSSTRLAIRLTFDECPQEIRFAIHWFDIVVGDFNNLATIAFSI